MPDQDQQEESLQDVIDDIERLDSERPSQVIHIENKRSLSPKQQGNVAKVVGAIVAVGALAEVLRQLIVNKGW